MLTIRNPEILSEVRDLGCGLMPLRISVDSVDPSKKISKLVLIIKAPKDYILTVKIRREFNIYLAPIRIGNLQTTGLVTAFFDDDGEPLCVRSPLCDDEFARDLFQLLIMKHFEVYFFDEHSRELLSYLVKNSDAIKFLRILNHNKLAQHKEFERSLFPLGQFDDILMDWFSRRSSIDDAKSLSIKCIRTLFPDDIHIFNANPKINSYHGQKRPIDTILERQDPGFFNELDIVYALHRTFSGNQIYLNPFRVDVPREFVDVLVAAKKYFLLIQAKDSPNTEATISRTIDRKKLVSLSHVEKAASQIRGSISYVKSNRDLEIFVDHEKISITTASRFLVGLIIVRELFDDLQSNYNTYIQEIIHDTGVPCFLMDYFSFHLLTHYYRTEGNFIDIICKNIELAAAENRVPRLRIWPDIERLLRDNEEIDGFLKKP